MQPKRHECVWRPVIAIALIYTALGTSSGLDSQTLQLNHPNELHAIYYHCVRRDGDIYLQQSSNGSIVQSQSSPNMLASEQNKLTTESGNYEGSGSYRYELEYKPTWRESEEVNTWSESEPSRSPHDFIGTCTVTEYKQWYSDHFPSDCKELFNGAADNEYTDLLYSHYCNTHCGTVYSNFLRSCGAEGKQLAEFYDRLCWTNERGVPCYLFLGRYQRYNPVSQVEALCLSLAAGNGCPLRCKRAVQSFRQQLGCCVTNIYNATSPGGLWSSCGVTVPDYCAEGYYNSVSGQTMLTAGNLIFVVTVSVMSLL